jgi:hypothetical protein
VAEELITGTFPMATNKKTREYMPWILKKILGSNLRRVEFIQVDLRNSRSNFLIFSSSSGSKSRSNIKERDSRSFHHQRFLVVFKI